MNRILTISRNNMIKLVALTLFGAIVFTFLHSELGFLNIDKGNHHTHDYCELVKNTNTHFKTLKEDIPKLEVNRDYCVHCFDDVPNKAEISLTDIAEQHLSWKYKDEIYLFNETFLI